ncbi:MAG: PIN domain-containing protein [Acidobacteriota bacterium]|nr:PIN domain-containing protein [Acidobacteriota bacterium]
MTGLADTMPNRDFFDSNILIYAADRSEPEKQFQARRLLNSAIENETGTLSVQVLGEFFSVVTKRIPNPLSVEEAEAIIERTAVLPVVELDWSLVRRAIDTHKEYGISYWDSLIVAAAEKAGCTRIISEDLNSGQSYHGITVVDPF